MESIIDTNGKSPRIPPRAQVKFGRVVGLGQFFGLGKREIISGFATLGQVRQDSALKAGAFNWVFLVIGAVCGCHNEVQQQIKVARVTGASMSPTIWGDHGWLQCDACAVQWKVNWQPAMRPPGDVHCWNCGRTLPPPEVQSRVGESVKIDTSAYRRAPPRLDDIVAVRDAAGVRIKRVLGVPGQVISSRSGALLCDGHPMTSAAPWIVIHDDSYRDRGESWWLAGGSPGVMQTQAGFEIVAVGSKQQLAKLTYRHRSVYNHLRPDRVRDDYPGNLVETRHLRGVTTLGVQAELDVATEATLHCWKWTPLGAVCESQQLAPGDRSLDVRWSHLHDETNPPPEELGAQRPICLSVEAGTLSISKLRILRPILYWIHDHRAVTLPLTLEPDCYFVIGDNVPLSIDSRQSGPVARSDIIGKVLSSDERSQRHEFSSNPAHGLSKLSGGE